MYAEVFPTRLKRARNELGLTQVETAKLLRIDKSTIAKYETGRTEPNLEMLALISRLFQVSADWLIGLTSHEPNLDLNRQAREEQERVRILKKMERESELARRLTAQ